jgi:hypothetical protein
MFGNPTRGVDGVRDARPIVRQANARGGNPAESQVGSEGPDLCVIAKGRSGRGDASLEGSQTVEVAGEADPKHAGTGGVGEAAEAIEGKGQGASA